MKKSNKSNKPEITPEEIMADFDKIMSFVGKIEGSDLSSLNIDEIDDQTKKIKKEIEDKYNPIIKKLKNNLDTEK
tara:strand:- start:20 stop:244 length:225 start_codon:yes stop_codon:yes gene_type:complete